MQKETLISIVIPCYNEEPNLAKLISRCEQMLSQFSGVQFVLVDNGSSDRTAAILVEKLGGNSSFKIISIRQNIGYGNGILRGLEQADGELLAWTHADLQTDPIDVGNAVSKYRDLLLSGKTVVKGQRETRNMFDAFFTKGMSLLASFMLGEKLDDINAQPKIFPRSFLSRFLQNAPLDFSLDTWFLFLARKSNYDILTYPVFFDKRIAGEAKGGGSLKCKLKLTRRTFAFLMKLRKETRGF